MGMDLSRSRTALGTAVALLAAITLTGCGGAPNPKERTMTLTLIRGAESAANDQGLLETVPPGPPLSADGQKQAASVANRLKGNDYDGVYASEFLRSQQTARPMAQALDEQVTVLPGLNEIPAGWFEGVPDNIAAITYKEPLRAWLQSNRSFGIPGAIDGTQFNGQFTAAVQSIYENGDDKPVAFSSGNAIMMWILMNVVNPKDSLLDDHPLPNTGVVKIQGNPVTGWKLLEWDGITDFSPDVN